MSQTEIAGTEQVVWNGADALRQYLVPIDTLQDHAKNLRKGDVAALRGSLEIFGQVRAILYDDATIVAGHHLRYAAVELGWTHIAAVPHRFESEEQRDAYLQVDNITAQLAGAVEQDKAMQMTFFEEAEALGLMPQSMGMADWKDNLTAELGQVQTFRDDMPEADFAESADDAAARAAALADSARMREVVLMFTQEQYDEFGRYVRVLQKAYKTEEQQSPGVILCVLRAVGEEAVRAELAEAAADASS